MTFSYSVTSKTANPQHTFRWRIEEFDASLKLSDRTLQSSSFSIPGIEGTFWLRIFAFSLERPTCKGAEVGCYFEVSVKGDGHSREQELAGTVAVSSDGTEEVLKGRFGDGGSLVFRDFAHWVFLSGETCEFFENRRKNNSTGGFYTRPGASLGLTVEAVISAPGRVVTKAEVESEPQESLPIFKPLLTESKHADVVLECGGRKFHCHKAVLSLRSPVLDRMLEVDMEEAAQGCIVIKDMEAEVLEKVLEYVYTGEVEEVGERLAELLYAGDKYQLTGLVHLCARGLQADLATENAVDVLVLADRHSLTRLKQVAMRRIVADKAAFLADPKFLQIVTENPELMLQLFSM